MAGSAVDFATMNIAFYYAARLASRKFNLLARCAVFILLKNGRAALL
ncbi:hypothetical protein [Paenibacillus wulumuqiensis]|nr:hypothetical protein [Paenibacillus wulumuqiensis]